MDPVLDGINVDSFGVLLTFLFLSALLIFLSSLLLERLKLLNFLADELICLLQVRLQLVDGLVLILHCLLIGDQVLVHVGLEFAEALLSILLLDDCLVSLLLKLSQLEFHGFQARFLLHHSLLNVVFLLLFLALLLVELVLKDLHLLFVFFLDGLGLS